MGNINFATILVTHTGGVKGAAISQIIAGNGNFFANGQKYHAMTHVNVSPYIYGTSYLINALNTVFHFMVISLSYSLIN